MCPPPPEPVKLETVPPFTVTSLAVKRYCKIGTSALKCYAYWNGAGIGKFIHGNHRKGGGVISLSCTTGIQCGDSSGIQFFAIQPKVISVPMKFTLPHQYGAPMLKFVDSAMLKTLPVPVSTPAVEPSP